MQYNPGVYDRSGEIIAAGTMQAAQTQADLMRELGEKARQAATAAAGFAAGGPAGAAMASGGGSGGGGGGEGIFSTLLNAYSQNKQLEAKASSYDDIGKILNTAMFKDNPDASAAFGNLQKEKDARKKVMGYEQLFSMVGPMSNMMMAQGRLGLQQQAPYVEAGLKNQQNIAGGNVPHGSMGVPRPPSGMGNVEPDLPVADEDLPAVNTPAAAPMQIPGGDESMRRYNEWKRQRGY